MKSANELSHLPLQLAGRIEAIKTLIIKQLEPKAVILFGSRANADFKKGSDIDIAVDTTQRLTTRQRRMLIQEIEEIAGIYSVDIVYSSSVDNDFFNHIKKQGIVLYETE